MNKRDAVAFVVVKYFRASATETVGKAMVSNITSLHAKQQTILMVANTKTPHKRQIYGL